MSDAERERAGVRGRGGRSWLEGDRLRVSVVAPGSPWQNGYAESFHSKVRDEFLNREEFESEPQARALGALWKEEYNTERPHSSLGYQTPAEFAALVRGMCLSMKTCPIPRLLNRRTGISHYRWIKKRGSTLSIWVCPLPFSPAGQLR